MGNKVIIALVCALIVPMALAQPKSKRPTYQTTTAPEVTATERITVFAPDVWSETGSAATYQPNKTFVVRTENANSAYLAASGGGLVYDKYGRPVTTPIPPGAKVRVFYTTASPERVIDHVVVEQ